MSAAKPRAGLGRGLDELFQRTTPVPGVPASPESDGPVAAAMSDRSYLIEIKVDDISPNPDQPRNVFDEEALAELADSIREVGLLQPIVVRPLADDKYELVMGERRWRASQLAGLETIPAVVRQTEEQDRLRDALLENLHRVQLNPLEEAAAYQQLLTDFGCTQEELANRIKRSRPQISNTIRLLRLPAAVQRRVAAGVLSAGHARALLSLEDPEAIEQLATRVVAEGLSVRATEEIATLSQKAPEERRPRVSRVKAVSPREAEIAEQLSDQFDTRVQVVIGANKGRIAIEFAGQDDLDRLLGLLLVPTGYQATRL